MLKYRKNIYFFPARKQAIPFSFPPRPLALLPSSFFSAAFALFSFGLAAEIKQEKKGKIEITGKREVWINRAISNGKYP